MYLVCLVNYVRRSRKPVRRLPFGRDTTGDMQFFLHIFNRICFELSTLLWTARGCVDGVRFYGPLQSESEFRHHLPVVLGIHNLPFGTCIWRTAGRCCRNYISNRSGSWKLTASTHGQVGLGPILTY